jgi:hypothetical protein
VSAQLELSKSAPQTVLNNQEELPSPTKQPHFLDQICQLMCLRSRVTGSSVPCWFAPKVPFPAVEVSKNLVNPPKALLNVLAFVIEVPLPG